MAMRRAVLAVTAYLLLTIQAGVALADAPVFSGYGDLRFVVPGDEDDTWLEGGLGKTRFANEDGGVELRFGEIAAEGRWQIDPAFMVMASVRYDEDQRTKLDVLEAFVRYRPVSTSEWRWSVTAGAFLPPISLENDEVGWTSYWTLTPSAINTWVGEEFRTLGAEAKVELRGPVDSFEANAALFGWNDPAGFLIDVRGWALHDRPTGLFDKVRLPDVFAEDLALEHATTSLFKEIDGRAGYYARAAWIREGLGRIEVLRYDNRADPETFDVFPAWRTEFWSAGLETQIGAFEILAQGLTGETEVAPFSLFDREVEIWSAYVLAGRAFGDWRVAARAEIFGSDAVETDLLTGIGVEDPEYSEHGHAFTLAVTYTPEEWVRLTAELLHVDSIREQREEAGLSPRSRETQLQIAGRFFF
jgi:hypothetical protein